jgi:membrane protein YfhO
MNDPPAADRAPAAAGVPPRRRERTPVWARKGQLALVMFPVAFNLWELRAERLGVYDLNDTSVHISTVSTAANRIASGHLGLDPWYSRLGLGLPQFHEYQTLAHVITGYLAVLIGATTATHLVLYIGLSLWPVAVYAGARMFGFDRWVAGAAALVSPVLVSAPSYGFEQSSYVWRGLGVWTQLWGMWLLPIALPLCWRAVAEGRHYARAALSLGLLTGLHFLTGYLALASLGVWVVLVPRQFVRRLGRAVLVAVGAMLTISFVIVPLLQDSAYEIQSSFNQGTIFNDSFGAGKVLHWLVRGELLDFGRWPVVSVLAAVGAVVALGRARREEAWRAVLGFTALSLVLFIGRKTWGSALEILPLNQDLLYSRFIVGVQLGCVLLAGLGASWLGRQAVDGLATLGREATVGREAAVQLDRWRPLVVAAAVVVAVLALVPAWRQLSRYDRDGTTLIHDQMAADATEGAAIGSLIQRATTLGGGRIYAGLPSSWGASYRVFDVPVYAEILDRGADGLGFTLRTESILTDVEPYFDDRDAAQYDLFDARYVIEPATRPAPPGATPLATADGNVLYQVPTTGYLEVVDTVAPSIRADHATMAQAPAAFLSSPLLARREFPTVAFDGKPAASPSLTAGATPDGPAGSVVSQYARSEQGAWGGTVRAARPAVVLLKVAYHPRIHATVDGHAVATEMVAPGMVGVPVPAGTHQVRFHYVEFQYDDVCLLVGALALAGLWWLPRRRRPVAGGPS